MVLTHCDSLFLRGKCHYRLIRDLIRSQSFKFIVPSNLAWFGLDWFGAIAKRV